MLYLQVKGLLCKQVPKEAKKLVVVSTTSTLITDKKTEEELGWVPCIRYPVTFKNQTEARLDIGSEVNAMSQAFA